MKQKKAYKYRFYPTSEQKQQLARTFGCVRFVYNWALRLKTDAYSQKSERLSYGAVSSALTALKKQEPYLWLNEVSSVPTQQCLRHLARGFRNFFEGRAQYPTFKKKRQAQSAEYTASAFQWRNGTVTLAKQREPLAIVWSRPLPQGCLPSTVTVTKDEADRYFVSILVEEDMAPLPQVSKKVGLDLGLKRLVITSDGQTDDNPGFLHKDEKKLAKLQRRHANKHKGSKNRDKARRAVARCRKKIADRRRDYQRKLSTTLIRENQVICVESLTVKNLVQNRHLAKAMSDAGWSEFVRQQDYTARWYGRTVVKIDRWYPSSKRCFDCGHLLPSLSLDVRTWTCPECGVHHDRDINAAQNILAAELAVTACGEAVRPGRAKARAGKPQ